MGTQCKVTYTNTKMVSQTSKTIYKKMKPGPNG